MDLQQGSDLQQRMYHFIVSCIKTEGRPPTHREIGRAIGISSTSQIHAHLMQLVKLGWITREAGKSRSIRLTTATTGIPLLGTIAAGVPLDIFPDARETLAFEHHASEDTPIYALRVKGDSMVEDAIYHGDYVLIQAQSTCQNGEIVVALHKPEGVEGSATLKRFFQEQDWVRLQPANATMEPLLIAKPVWNREWQIQGKVIALLRHYHSYLSY